ncbi:OmpA family protein [Sphingobacterium litopenaei]|uniref:OmpA family protein n=1 Tax=Sphingobacterium litopenaei TaxID=2763500 RepID=A0ABR7YCE1_9SPHI|nr:OmpA family protein [Sphingobacterium litopenaei]MBD1428971.1 OmpA family protein [Sphingobacterium litopenaei]
MKTISFTKLTTLLVAIFTTSNSIAQETTIFDSSAPSSTYRTWSMGLNVGLLSQENKFGFNEGNLELGYSAYLKKHLSPNFGFKFQYLGGKIREESNSTTQFETKLPWSFAFSGEYVSNLFNSNVVRPYLSAGIGYLNLNRSSSSSETDLNRVFIPVDLGLKFVVSKGVNLDLGYQLNWTNDYFDGKTNHSFPYDLFSYLHAGVEFALGSKSKAFIQNTKRSNSNDLLALKYDELKAGQDALLKSQQAINDQLSKLAKDLKDDDNDGVANIYDKCPNTPAGTKVDGAGCPLPELKLTDGEKQVVIEAVRNLEFDFNKATIRSSSFSYLDKVAELMKDKGYNLKLDGYTDNIGSDAVNQKLSKDRADAVKAYLVSKGVESRKIETAGHGSKFPISSNSTEEGRQQNRRVEFSLY